MSEDKWLRTAQQLERENEQLEAQVAALTKHLDKINRHYLMADEIAGYVEIDTDLLKPIAALIRGNGDG
jgi:cell division septum initiation protein DivIVA